MINLIPIEERKELKKYFFLRLLSVFLFMFGISFFIGIVLISPSYFYAYSKKNTVENKLENQQKEEMPKIDQDAQKAINNLNEKLDLVEQLMGNKYVVSEKIFGEILSRKISGIKIKRIYYENNLSTGKTVVVDGIATNRETLLSFRRMFENSEVFKSVELPISNFVKGHNIEFSINLVATL